MIEPLDLDLAAAGWLTSPWGKVRHIRGIDILARDARTLGARVYWDCSDGCRAGRCVITTRQIYLAAWLFPVYPFVIRRVWAEELAHLVVGPSDERALLWRARQYSGLVEPVWV